MVAAAISGRPQGPEQLPIQGPLGEQQRPSTIGCGRHSSARLSRAVTRRFEEHVSGQDKQTHYKQRQNGPGRHARLAFG
jgi:hypothetical protein